MAHKQRSSISVVLVSPYGLAAFSCLLFAVAWLFPPGLYTELMQEPDLLFLNIPSALFYAACVTGFFVGLYLVDSYFPTERLTDPEPRPSISQTAFVLGPLCTALVMNLFSLASVLREGVLLPLLLSGAGGEAKDLWMADGSLVLTSTCLAGVVWWAIWRSAHLHANRISRFAIRGIIYFSIVVVVLSASLILNRIVLFAIVLGSVVIALSRGALTGRVSGKTILKSGLLAGVVLVLLFVFYSSLRASSETDGPTSDLVQYTISSYNRLPPLLSGDLRYPFAGRGVYLAGFLQSNNTLNSVVPFREIFQWPTYSELFQSEFASLWKVNLNSRLIWLGTFGYIYSDLGWLAPAYLLLYGVLYGFVWRGVRSGQTFGIVLYPWFAFCILFWVGTNELLDTMCVVLAIDAAALTGYEWLLASRKAPLPFPPRHRARVAPL
jgi:hypothetical protein